MSDLDSIVVNMIRYEPAENVCTWCFRFQKHFSDCALAYASRATDFAEKTVSQETCDQLFLGQDVFLAIFSLPKTQTRPEMLLACSLDSSTVCLETISRFSPNIKDAMVAVISAEAAS